LTASCGAFAKDTVVKDMFVKDMFAKDMDAMHGTGVLG